MLKLFSQRLTFRLGVSVVMIEIIFMTVVGIIYFNRFAAQIDARQVERLQTAAEMINQNRLNLTALTDRDTMSLLVGEEIQDAMLITDKGMVAFSLNPEYRRMAIEDIPFLDQNDLNFEHPTPILKRVEIEGQPYLVSITPSPGADQLSLILYFRTSVAGAEREKANVIILLLTGFAATVAATSTALTLVLNRTVLARVGKLALAASKVEAGDLTVRADTDGTGHAPEDEIAILQHGFNAMVERLQGFIATLEQRVAERTHALSESNQQLLKAKDDAEEARRLAETANRAKSTFLANMSHELRTPLNGILGYADILKRRSGHASDLTDGLDIIQSSGEHLLTLINDILDLARVEAGKLELVPASFHLPTFLNQLTSIIRMRAETKDISLTCKALSPLPEYVLADEKRLRQVLLNLLGNAVKFTDQGSVTLCVSALPVEGLKVEGSTLNIQPSTVTLRFKVTDTGIGMTPNQLERIFQPFEQVSEPNRRAEGTGLGLSISQQIVQLMGSRLQVQSEAGRGSTFWFEVSLLVVTTGEEPKPPASQPEIIGYEGERRKVLVADDKDYNRLLLRDMLDPLGFEVRLANDGQEAVEKTLSWHPDAIVMDLVMPVKTGIEAALEIRQQPALREVVIIAVSASVVDAEQEKSKLAGCNAFLPKPIEAQRLLDLLAKPLGLAWVYAEADAGSETPLVPPPAEELAALYQLAMEGRVFNIQAQAVLLEKLGEAYIPFARRLQKLARGFDIDQIRAFLKQFMR